MVQAVELNATERLWQFMRDTLLPHRLFTDLKAILDVSGYDAVVVAWGPVVLETERDSGGSIRGCLTEMVRGRQRLPAPARLPARPGRPAAARFRWRRRPRRRR